MIISCWSILHFSTIEHYRHNNNRWVSKKLSDVGTSNCKEFYCKTRISSSFSQRSLNFTLINWWLWLCTASSLKCTDRLLLFCCMLVAVFCLHYSIYPSINGSQTAYSRPSTFKSSSSPSKIRDYNVLLTSPKLYIIREIEAEEFHRNKHHHHHQN